MVDTDLRAKERAGIDNRIEEQRFGKKIEFKIGDLVRITEDETLAWYASTFDAVVTVIGGGRPVYVAPKSRAGLSKLGDHHESWRGLHSPNHLQR